MDHSEQAITILSERECWERLAQQEVGRIVTHVGDIVDVVPVNYVVDGETLLFRTAAGNKLNELTINPRIAFEVDEFDKNHGWSVVVHGVARALETEHEIFEAERLPLRPFVPTLKPVFVRITPETATGRTFRFGEEPRREDLQEG